jgi:proteasome accessory factor B
MAADYTRIHRLLKLLTLIQGEKGWTSPRLARECNVTQRTIYRDLKMLQGAGIPYFYDEPTGGYSIRRDFFLPPVQLTLDESLALSALAEHVGGQEQVPFTNAAAKAICKIRGLLPDDLRQSLEQSEKHLSIQLAAAMPPESSRDVYDAVRLALERRRTLRCRYESLGKESNNHEFLFNPYALFFNQRAWYVVGHHDGHRATRCLKLSRFTSLQPTDLSYDVPSDFSLSSHLGNAWRMIRGDKSYDVELRIDADFSETIADTHWHATQEVTWNKDQSITFRCRVDGLDEIVWWVMSMGPHCLVRKPAELARRVKKLAGEIVRQYDNPHPPHRSRADKPTRRGGLTRPPETSRNKKPRRRG